VELVYGEPLNLPDDFIADNQENSSINDPTSLLDHLRLLYVHNMYTLIFV